MSHFPRLVFAAALLVGAPTAASAQFGGSVQFSWNQQGSRFAYEQGYERGQRAGLEDARRGDRFGFVDESDFRRGDTGYRSQFGSRDRYRDQFRVGFEVGYRSGYERSYGPVGRGNNGPPWTNGRGGARFDLASSTGFSDGYQAGASDARDRDRFDPISEGRYRSADHGYERSYGNKEIYKNNYRDAFRLGYQQGYADGRRY